MYLDHLADFIHSSGAYKKSGLDLPDIDVRGLTSSYVTSSVETENLINNRRKNIFSWRAYNFIDFDDHISEAAPNSVESEGRFRLSTILSHLSFGVHRNLVSEFGFQHPEVLVALDAPEVLLRLQEG